jgi:hypothetical protein
MKMATVQEQANQMYKDLFGTDIPSTSTYKYVNPMQGGIVDVSLSDLNNKATEIVKEADKTGVYLTKQQAVDLIRQSTDFNKFAQMFPSKNIDITQRDIQNNTLMYLAHADTPEMTDGLGRQIGVYEWAQPLMDFVVDWKNKTINSVPLLRSVIDEDPRIGDSSQGISDAINQLPAMQEADKYGYPNQPTSAGTTDGTGETTPTTAQAQREDTARQIIQEQYGRDATDVELDFYTKALAQGISPYELQITIQQTPEYIERQNQIQQEKYKAESQAMLGDLQTNMLAQEEEAFKRATPQILAEYMRSGRINSSGLDSAITNSRAKLAKDRENYMAQLQYQNAVTGLGYNREDYVNNQGNAYQNYLRQTEPDYQANAWLAMNKAQMPYAQASDRLTRAQQIQDFYMQQNSYDKYLQQMMRGQDKAGMYGLYGNIAGGVLGGLTGGLFNK